MAFYLNQFHCIGNLVSDPELKTIGQDKKVCKFRIAVNNPHNENALFFAVDVWGKEGEKCNLLKKGSQVFITNASILPKTYNKTSSCGEEIKVNTFTVNVDGYCGKVQFGPKNIKPKDSQQSSQKSPSPKDEVIESQSEPEEDTSSFEEEFEF